MGLSLGDKSRAAVAACPHFGRARTSKWDRLRDAELRVARARWHVNHKNIELAPVDLSEMRCAQVTCKPYMASIAIASSVDTINVAVYSVQIPADG